MRHIVLGTMIGTFASVFIVATVGGADGQEWVLFLALILSFIGLGITEVIRQLEILNKKGES